VSAPARVSVVIPTYNRADLLPRAVRSVLGQTLDDFELIVVDDGSTDRTRDVVRELDDTRVRALFLEHAGVSRARNAAIGIARGEWIAFLDDDDEWLPPYLERQLAHLDAAPNAGAVYCTTKRLTEDGETLVTPLHCPSGAVFDDLLQRWKPSTSATMVRRELVLQVGGFSRELEWLEDHEFMMRVALRAPFVCNPETLTVREEHSRPRVYYEDPLLMAHSLRVVHRRWRSEIIARRGVRAYVEWTRRWWIPEELRVMVREADRCGRVAGWTALRHLTAQLPWAVGGFDRALTMLVAGPRGYARARAALTKTKPGR